MCLSTLHACNPHGKRDILCSVSNSCFDGVHGMTTSQICGGGSDHPSDEVVFSAWHDYAANSLLKQWLKCMDHVLKAAKLACHET